MCGRQGLVGVGYDDCGNYVDTPCFAYYNMQVSLKLWQLREADEGRGAQQV